jgi:acyl-CoA 6-desaturase (Delta-6 desaturase)
MEKKYIKINEDIYDITDFSKIHPGGGIINHYVGFDGTQAFKAFHFRSEKAGKMLKTLTKVDPINTSMDNLTFKQYSNNDNTTEMLVDFEKWHQSLVDRGFFKPSYFHIFYRMLELILIFITGSICFSNSMTILGVLLYGLFLGRCGWLGHEAGHKSLTGIKNVDIFFHKLIFGFGAGISSRKWNSMHNKHHASTQKETFDPDLNTTPFVAFYNKAIEDNQSHYYSIIWLKYQALTFIPITSGLLLSLFWVLYLHPVSIIKKRDWTNGLFVIMSYVIKLFLISRGGYSLIMTSLLLFLSLICGAMYLFGHFSLSHTFMPTIKNDEFPNWVDFSLYHTVDIEPQNPLICWIMGYLNCQCVHHLFPQMPQFRQPEVSLELIQFAKKWNRPYTIISYKEAWKRMFDNLNQVGKDYEEKSKKK